jgi:hypothetical protein
MSVEPIPQREVVTRSPRRTRSAAASAPVQGVRERTEDPDLSALMRRQLRSSLTGLTTLAVPTALLPVLLLLAPSSSGPALTWILLGFCGYPPLVLLAWWYVRRAERHERDHVRLAKGD